MECEGITSARGYTPNPTDKSKNDDKSDKYFVNIKLRRDPESEKLDLYEFKMALFDNVDREDLFLFIHNFKITLEASRTLGAGEKVQCICTMVRGEALSQFDVMSADVESATPITLEDIILGLCT